MAGSAAGIHDPVGRGRSGYQRGFGPRPRTWLGAGHLRAFLFGRAAWSELGSLMIVSGAFGVFRKDVVVEIGGFRHDTVGEDMDLVVRMHRHLRAAGRPYRVAFVPDPVCWTTATRC